MVVYMSVWEGGVGNTKDSDRDVCKAMRARELWIGMGARGT